MTVVMEQATVDGRHRRRHRNRTAVVDALLELYGEGIVVPGADEIAARAGISARSLFRYFDDLDDLAGAAIARQQERLAPLWELPAVDALGSLDDRLDRFVEARVRLLEAMGAVGRVARLRAVTQPVVAGELRRIRRALREQVAQVFAPELAARRGADRTRTLAALDVALSWESYDLLRHDQGLGRAEATRTIRDAGRRLLEQG